MEEPKGKSSFLRIWTVGRFRRYSHGYLWEFVLLHHRLRGFHRNSSTRRVSEVLLSGSAKCEIRSMINVRQFIGTNVICRGVNSRMPNHCFELSTSETIWYEGTSSYYLTKRGPERSHSFCDKITVVLPRVQVGRKWRTKVGSIQR